MKQRPTYRRKTRRAKRTPGMDFLRDHTFATIYGEETEYGVYPSITAKDYIARDLAGWKQRKLANYRFADHFAGTETYFYFGNGARFATFTLVKIDIDVLKSKGKGSREGARAFLAHLQERWPKLYAETSRSGNGVNAWLRLRKVAMDAGQVNAVLKRFAEWLRAEARGFDVEGVEVKGHCPELSYSEFGSLNHVKYGTFARFPRNAEDCSHTQVVSAVELGKLEMRPTEDKTEHVEAHSSGWIVQEEDLERLPALEKAVGSLRMKAGRWMVTAKDWAYFLLLCAVLPENKDGSNGYRRYEKVWTELYAAGKFERGWNYRRFKAMRDWLSEHGHIEWLDERYCPGNGDRPGIATKWRLSEEFRDWLEGLDVDEREAHHWMYVTGTRGEASLLTLAQLDASGRTGLDVDEREALHWMDLTGTRGEASLLTLAQLQKGPHAHKLPILAFLFADQDAEWHEWAEKGLERLFAA